MKACSPKPFFKRGTVMLLLAALLLLCACDSLPALSGRVNEPSYDPDAAALYDATPVPSSEPIVVVLAGVTPDPVITAPPSPTPTPTPTVVPTPTASPTAVPTSDPNRRMIALTFDDGPVTEYTAQILDLLKQYGVHGTFFVQGNKISGDEEVLCRIVDEGHELGLHGWNHTKMTEQSEGDMRTHFSNTAERVALALGDERSYQLHLMRPPYGSTNGSVYSAMRGLGLSVVKWTVDSRDWELRNTDAIVELCTKLTDDGQIWLFHDKFQTTVDAVALLIPYLISEGYDLVTVSELIESSGQPPEAGRGYQAKPTP